MESDPLARKQVVTMPPERRASVREAVMVRAIEVISDANGMKDGDEHSVGVARRHERDALKELIYVESVGEAEDVALPSERV